MATAGRGLGGVCQRHALLVAMQDIVIVEWPYAALLPLPAAQSFPPAAGLFPSPLPSPSPGTAAAEPSPGSSPRQDGSGSRSPAQTAPYVDAGQGRGKGG